MITDDLGDRMKLYENAECDRRFMPLLPICARIDGRAFHSFTRGMQRPYDNTFRRVMVETTRALMQETNAALGYTQSDEISLTWHSTDARSQIWFDGRITKMTSQLAAQATLAFYEALMNHDYNEYCNRRPTFDARVWSVPNRSEACNMFLWREWDATKNSLSMAAAAYYSHKELEGKNGADKHDMLMAKGINWNDYPAYFKRGTYVQRRSVVRPFTVDEINVLPEKHAARSNPNLMVERTEYQEVNMPIFSTICNKEAVVFEGAEPIRAEKS